MKTLIQKSSNVTTDAVPTAFGQTGATMKTTVQEVKAVTTTAVSTDSAQTDKNVTTNEEEHVENDESDIKSHSTLAYACQEQSDKTLLYETDQIEKAQLIETIYSPEKKQDIKRLEKKLVGITMIPIAQLKTDKKFSDVLKISPETLSGITESMKRDGFSQTEPLTTWNNVLVDGHTRLAAAKEAGITEVPAVEHNFTSDAEALDYLANRNLLRRNLSDGQLYTLFTIKDMRKKRGRPRKDETENSSLPAGKSAPVTASILGIGETRVKRMRAIRDGGNKRIIGKLLRDEISMNEAYEMLKKGPKDSSGIEVSSKAVKADTDKVDTDKVDTDKADTDTNTSKVAQSVKSQYADLTHPLIIWSPNTADVKFTFPEIERGTIAELNRIPGGGIIQVGRYVDILREAVTDAKVEAILGTVRDMRDFTFVFYTFDYERITNFRWPVNSLIVMVVQKSEYMDVLVKILGEKRGGSKCRLAVRIEISAQYKPTSIKESDLDALKAAGISDVILSVSGVTADTIPAVAEVHNQLIAQKFTVHMDGWVTM